LEGCELKCARQQAVISSQDTFWIVLTADEKLFGYNTQFSKIILRIIKLSETIRN
jgi:hypothetical protein